MSTARRFPLQSRHPNMGFGSSSSLSSNGGDDSTGKRGQLSTLESSHNENNKARFNSSGSIRGYPGVEMGNEHDSSLVTNTGAGSKGIFKRQASGGSMGSQRSASSQEQQKAKLAAASSKKRVPPSSDQDIVIEEKRKRINGEGYTVHRYLRGRMLGKGGFAKVYLCTALDTNKNYAVKVVPKANLVKTRARQKLQAEIKIHRTLKHRRVCEYKHFFEDRNNCYILLELCHNQSMNELLKRRKRLTEPEAAYFMSQLVEAVEYMHGECVIHRDLKLGNLFIDKNLGIKVGDLGLATKLENAEEKRKTICGTPNYIAPEVIQGTKETRGHSFEVDVWSMGVILFTVLAGKPPYEAKDVKATYQRIISNEYRFPDHVSISDAAKDLIVSMLQSNPHDRPTLDEMQDHPFFRMQIPDSLPSSILHIAPEWELDEFGNLVVGSLDGSEGNRSSRSGVRLPFSTKDPNAIVAQKQKVEKREREVRDAVQERLRATLSSAKPPSSTQFQIFDETESTKSCLPKTPKAALASMDQIIARATQLSLGDRRDSPEVSTQTPERPMDDSEILNQMLESLSTALEVAEQRKFTYSHFNAAEPTDRGGPSIWVNRYVDYTSKYGLGFLLNNGCSGVYFNDSTKAVLQAEGDTFHYVERRKVESSNGGMRKNEPVCETLSLEDHPENLSKKVTLLKHFRNYLIEQQKSSNETPIETMSADSDTLPMVFLKKWVRTKHAILFRLSNQTVQIVFYDQTEVLLTPDKRFVTYVDKKRKRSTYYLNDELVGTNAEMAKRLKYSKEILSQLLTGQQKR